MTKFVLTIFLFIHAIGCYPQASGVVVDTETREPIPYVNIGAIGQSNGTNCNESGYFEIDVSKDDSLVFSAVGFQTEYVAVQSIGDTLFLEKQMTFLREVVVKPREFEDEVTLGEYKANRIHYFTGTSSILALAARYFAYPDNFNGTPYLDELSIYTKSEVEGAKFIVRLYEVNEDGSPGDYLHGENIYGYAKKGWKRTKVELTDLNIIFPENGLFVAVESLLIGENEYILEHDDPLDKSKKPRQIKTLLHAPAFGHIPKGSEEWGWQFRQGEWKYRKMKGKNESYATAAPIAVALTVKN